MNKENYKTLLLAFLVITTIYFSKNLWERTIDNRSLEYSRSEKIEDSSNKYNLSDIIIPQKTLVTLSESSRTVIYSNNRYDIWNRGKLALESIFNNNFDNDIINPEKYVEPFKNQSIEFEFSEQLYTHIVGKILEVEIPKNIYKQIKTISSIKFSIGAKSFIILSNNDEELVISIEKDKLKQLVEALDEIKSSDYTKFYNLEDVLGVKSNVYMPVESKSTVPTVLINTRYTINKDRKLDDTIAELFFYKKIEYIRKVEESSGASIYIDGENVLKIYYDGRLEYIGNTETDNDSDLYSSIKESVDFVSTHRGWPENVYLSNIEEIKIDENKSGYKFIFRYKLNGLTVFSDKENIQDKIEIEVINGSVVSYKSRIWNSLDIKSRQSEENIKSAFEIIDKNFVFLKEKYIINSKDSKLLDSEQIDEQVKSSINDIYLAYYGYLTGDQEILKPAWVIEILGQKHIFDAYSGEIQN